MNDPKVRLNVSPSEQVIAKAAQEAEVIDALGRIIVLRKPGPLAQFRVVEAVGNDAAKNEVYMGMVLPLIFVVSIDEAIVPPPVTKAQIEALIQRLGEEGIAAVAEGVYANFGKQDPEKDKAEIKK
jgi:hypothetical protein